MAKEAEQFERLQAQKPSTPAGGLMSYLPVYSISFTILLILSPLSSSYPDFLLPSHAEMTMSVAKILTGIDWMAFDPCSVGLLRYPSLNSLTGLVFSLSSPAFMGLLLAAGLVAIQRTSERVCALLARSGVTRS